MSTPKPSAPMFDKIALIGIGLIGGSIALAARRGGFARQDRGRHAARRKPPRPPTG